MLELNTYEIIPFHRPCEIFERKMLKANYMSIKKELLLSFLHISRHNVRLQMVLAFIDQLRQFISISILSKSCSEAI